MLEAKAKEEDEFYMNQPSPKTLKDHEVTGKYLYEADLDWCKVNTKLEHGMILRWFKRFRKACPSGRMYQKEFLETYNRLYIGNGDIFTREIYRLYDMNYDTDYLDFKDFLVIFEVTRCSTIPERLKWLYRILDLSLKGNIPIDRLKNAMKILDQLHDRTPDQFYEHPQDFIDEEENEEKPTIRPQDERLLLMRKYFARNDIEQITMQVFAHIPIRIISAYKF